MKTNFILFLKYRILIILLVTNISISAQKVETGIYEVIYDTDTAFVHQNTIKVNAQDPDNNIKYVYNYNYTNYIDKAYEIKYAVIIKTENPQDTAQFNLDMVWLNKKISKDYNFFYQDDIKRKFIKYQTAIKNVKPSERVFNENDYVTKIFLKHSKKTEYPDSNGDEKGKYDQNIFGINKNYFFIKSNIYLTSKLYNPKSQFLKL